MEIGPPCVIPKRTPPMILTLSASKFCLAPRPKPNLRRAKAASISAVVIETCAGNPSMIADKAGP